MTQSHTTQQNGFTMMEMLVAVFVFSLTVTGFVLVGARGVFSVQGTMQGTIAQHLAQEAMELARSKRDFNVITDVAWNDTLSVCTESYGCRVDAFNEPVDDDAFIDSCGDTEACSVLYLDKSGNKNIYHDARLSVGNEESTFRRAIFYEAISADSARIRVRVWWDQGKVTRRVELSTILTDWKAP